MPFEFNDKWEKVGNWQLFVKKLPIGTFVLEGQNMVLEPSSCIAIGSMMKYTQIYDQDNIKRLISIFRFCTLPTCISFVLLLKSTIR